MVACVLLLLSSATFAASTPPAPPPQHKYNVLYLIADDLRPEFSGAYGQSQVKTPNVARFAASALVFEKAYCQQAVCGPSRNSFMTGRRPHHTNVLQGQTGTDFRISGIDAAGVPGSKWTTLPGHFKRAGFTTLGGGKTFHPNTPKNFDYPRSWSDDMATVSTTKQGYFGFSYFLANFSRPFAGGLPIAYSCPGAGKPAGEANVTGNSLGGPIAVWCGLDLEDRFFYDNGLANNTIERLQYGARVYKASGKPFFIMSGFARPHTPWRVPQRFWDLYDTEDIALAEHKLPPKDMPGVAWMAHSFWNATTGEVWPLNVTSPLTDHVARTARHAYYASVSWLDHEIGRILDEVKRLGVEDSTIVVLHGDHGWQLGEHNSWHKYTNFELGVRVPLVIRAPMFPASQGKIAAGLAELVDTYPTIADLAGVPVTNESVDGVSLRPFFEEPSTESFHTAASQGTANKTLAFSQYPHTDGGASVPATECPFFREGTCHAAPSSASAAAAAPEGEKSSKGSWMGFSLRSQDGWRYTAWMPFNGSRADWSAGQPERQELYRHDYGLDTTSMDAIDDVTNVAYQPEHQARSARYFGLVREFFFKLQPPTAPAGGSPKKCASWCTTKWSPAQYCKFVACATCAACKK